MFTNTKNNSSGIYYKFILLDTVRGEKRTNCSVKKTGKWVFIVPLQLLHCCNGKKLGLCSWSTWEHSLCHWNTDNIMVSLNFLVNSLRLRPICFTSRTTTSFTGDFTVPVLCISGFRWSWRACVGRRRSFNRHTSRRCVAGGSRAVVDIACAATYNYKN